MSATRLALNNKELSAAGGTGGDEVVGGDSMRNSGGRRRSSIGRRGRVVEASTPRNSTDSLASNIERPSRDPSPIRMNLSSTGLSDSNITPAHHYKTRRRPGSVRSAAASRETSPIRSVSAAAAAVLRNSQQPDLQQPRPQRPLASAPHWPSTSRLGLSRSPPPGSRSPAPSPFKKTEHTTSGPLPHSIVLLRDKDKDAGLEDPEDQNLPSGMRTPRSNASPALETVVEGSLPNTPASGTSKTLTEQVAALVARQSNSNTNTIHEESESEVSVETVKGRGSRAPSISSSIAQSLAESESESGYKSEDKQTYATARVAPPSKPFSRRPTVMGSDNFSGRMTVETETVTSVPQVALGAGLNAGGASIRSKKSTDTIRAPRKKEKRVSKRAGGAGNSNLTSKTDIFAAKIAEAVDEANSSDSGETFVYESNPPEPSTIPRPTSRFHSRTPSATSIQGPDPRGQRLPLLPSIDGQQSSGRKGMKFTSVNSNLGNETPVGDGTGNERGGNGGGGSSRADDRSNQRDREKNGSRNANGHRSILTDESPFHNGPSHKASAHSLRHGSGSHISSRSTSQSSTPRHGAALRNGLTIKKLPRTWHAFDPEEGADDERVPLMSPRPGRTHRNRRPGSGSLRQLEHNAQIRHRGWLRTYIGCIVAVVAVILIMTGVGGFLFATTKALVDVSVLRVTGVLVSKQEIMLDLIVEAINPNAISVTVGSMDVNLFAKSSYVGDGKGKDGGDELDPGDGGEDGDSGDDGHELGWWKMGKGRSRGRETGGVISLRTEHLSLSTTRTRYRTKVAIINSKGGVDEGTDPPEDMPGGDRQTMLLGRIFSFDSALTFEASPLRHKSSISIGELRLAKPGNKTEEGGTERWERVLQHPFELIVRGVLKYSLPLSGRIRTAPIGASVIVHPDGATKEIGDGYEYYDEQRNDRSK